MKMTAAEIAGLTGGELEGAHDHLLSGAAGLADAGEHDVSFLGNPKYASQAHRTRAGCLILPNTSRNTPLSSALSGTIRARLFTDDPQWAFALVLRVLEGERNKPAPALVDARSVVHYETRLGPNVSVGPFSVLERRVQVGEGSSIGSNCFLGADVRIGRGCRIYPHVTIREDCVVGDRVILHSGAVVGSDGFGFSTDPKTGAHRKIPQIGSVVIEDDVEIGSNVSIDRATIGVTRIGAGTKIDNLVQIAHNVAIGKNCLIVAQSGIAGSTRLGDRVVVAGQAGIVGHITIGDGAVITAQTGVMGDVEPKAVLFGSPARPHREAMRLQALFGRLPELFDAVKQWKAGPEKQGRREGHHAQR